MNCVNRYFSSSFRGRKASRNISEEYFQQLYNAELQSWLDLQEEVASNMKNNESINTNDNTEYLFNKKKEIEQFYDSFIYNQE